MKTLVAMIGGIVSAAATMTAVFAIESYTGFNLFSWSLWLVVPAGAALTGFLSTSGVFGMGWLVHTRPSWVLFLFVVALAAASMVGFYYAAYLRDLSALGASQSDISFLDYSVLYFENMAFEINNSSVDLGENGKWFALLDLVGFAAGGCCLFLILAQSLRCEKCSRYFRPSITGMSWYNKDEFAFFYDIAGRHDVSEQEIQYVVNSGSDKQDANNLPIEWERRILKCDGCGALRWKDNVKAWNGKEWAEVHALGRNFDVTRLRLPVNLFNSRTGQAVEASNAYYAGYQKVAELAGSRQPNPEKSNASAASYWEQGTASAAKES